MSSTSESSSHCEESEASKNSSGGFQECDKENLDHIDEGLADEKDKENEDSEVKLDLSKTEDSESDGIFKTISEVDDDRSLESSFEGSNPESKLNEEESNVDGASRPESGVGDGPRSKMEDEVKSDVEPKSENETEDEARSESKVDDESMSEVEQKSDDKADDEARSESNVDDEQIFEYKFDKEPESELNDESEIKLDCDAKSDDKFDNESTSEVKFESQSAVESKFDEVSENKSNNGSETNLENEAISKANVNDEFKYDTESKSDEVSDNKSKDDGETKLDNEAIFEVNVNDAFKSVGQLNSEVDAKSNTQVVEASGSKFNGESESKFGEVLENKSKDSEASVNKESNSEVDLTSSTQVDDESGSKYNDESESTLYDESKAESEEECRSEAKVDHVSHADFYAGLNADDKFHDESSKSDAVAREDGLIWHSEKPSPTGFAVLNQWKNLFGDIDTPLHLKQFTNSEATVFEEPIDYLISFTDHHCALGMVKNKTAAQSGIPLVVRFGGFWSNIAVKSMYVGCTVKVAAYYNVTNVLDIREMCEVIDINSLCVKNVVYAGVPRATGCAAEWAIVSRPNITRSLGLVTNDNSGTSKYGLRVLEATLQDMEYSQRVFANHEKWMLTGHSRVPPVGNPVALSYIELNEPHCIFTCRDKLLLFPDYYGEMISKDVLEFSYFFVWVDTKLEPVKTFTL
ncbi:unnamed protein product [Bursaphelenchus okinawaensis]|uniref:Uncharacterized protein n=1 Tax=Bursaphelenchus okinawaensis TaxID=465554 RepID=A0A811LSG0_9BILA|nr:unnamed protein product [Bursaphelenchus okinawaensis]CAG9127235.1 unnamed protein product [Bursaphelenchus okinawaensis]